MGQRCETGRVVGRIPGLDEAPHSTSHIATQAREGGGLHAQTVDAPKVHTSRRAQSVTLKPFLAIRSRSCAHISTSCAWSCGVQGGGAAPHGPIANGDVRHAHVTAGSTAVSPTCPSPAHAARYPNPPTQRSGIAKTQHLQEVLEVVAVVVVVRLRPGRRCGFQRCDGRLDAGRHAHGRCRCVAARHLVGALPGI